MKERDKTFLLSIGIGLVSLTLLVFSQLWAIKIQNVSRFTFVNSLFLIRNQLVIASDGGVVLLDVFPLKIKNTYVTERPVTLAVLDPLTNDIYFVTGGNLKKWNPFMTWSTPLGYVGRATSLGIDVDFLYVEVNGNISKYTKSGTFLGKVGPSKTVKWAGKRGEISKDDPFLIHLSPFFIQTENLGRVELTSIVRDFDRTRLWVGTKGAGVYLYNTHTWQPVDSISFGVLPRPVLAFFFMDDTLWIGGRGGLTAKVGDRWISYSREGIYQLTCEEVRDLSGSGGTLWALTDCGLLRHQSSFNLFRVSDVTQINVIKASSPYLWVGGDRGVGWMPLSGGDIDWVGNSNKIEVEDVLTTSKNVYILSLGGVLVFDRLKREWRALEDPKEWGNVLAEKGATKGDTVVIATQRGILAFVEGTDEFNYIDPPFSPNRVYVNDIALNDYGIFVGTNMGLFIRESKTGTWRRYGKQDGFASEKVNSLWARGDTVYVGTDLGVTIIVP